MGGAAAVMHRATSKTHKLKNHGHNPAILHGSIVPGTTLHFWADAPQATASRWLRPWGSLGGLHGDWELSKEAGHGETSAWYD